VLFSSSGGVLWFSLFTIMWLTSSLVTGRVFYEQISFHGSRVFGVTEGKCQNAANRLQFVGYVRQPLVNKSTKAQMHRLYNVDAYV
jgi:hypothetical protein